jgi:hypothetical protein
VREQRGLLERHVAHPGDGGKGHARNALEERVFLAQRERHERRARRHDIGKPKRRAMS